MRKLNTIWIIFLLSSCAQIVSPTGGAKDTTSPKVKSILPEDETTNFSASEIKIRFDEYIDIKDPEQIIISPIIKEKPEIESDGKSITINLKRSKLDRDKTYTINFGNAIADIHEGTRLENFSYAFTTGEKIDTCKINGSITSALTGKPEQKFTIGLYDSNKIEDSLYIKNYPIYLSKSNEKGLFTLKNLPDKTFAIFGFNDQNKNLKFDPNEDYTFINTLSNPCENGRALKLKSNLAKLFQKDKITDTVQLNASTYALAIYDNENLQPNPKENYTRIQKFDNQIDTLYYYTKTKNDSGSTTLTYLIKNDVNAIEIKNKRKGKPNTFDIEVAASLNPKDTLVIKSKTPFKLVNKDSILLIQDTLPIPIKLLRIDSFSIHIPIYSKPGESYELEIKDSALTDIWGNKLRKRKNKIAITQEKETGTIQFSWTNNKNTNFIIELITEAEKPEVLKTILVTKSTKQLLSYVKPGIYYLRVTEDLNKNNRWDAANWRNNKEMEPITILPIKLTVKANWEIEQNINLDNLEW